MWLRFHFNTIKAFSEPNHLLLELLKVPVLTVKPGRFEEVTSTTIFFPVYQINRSLEGKRRDLWGHALLLNQLFALCSLLSLSLAIFLFYLRILFIVQLWPANLLHFFFMKMWWKKSLQRSEEEEGVSFFWGHSHRNIQGDWESSFGLELMDYPGSLRMSLVCWVFDLDLNSIGHLFSLFCVKL